MFLEQSITSQPIGFDPDPFVHSGTIAWRHQWDSNHTSSPGEKPDALILADQNSHAVVYATLPYYLIRDTLLLKFSMGIIFKSIYQIDYSRIEKHGLYINMR